MERYINYKDYNDFFQLILERSNLTLVREGETFAVYGDNFLDDPAAEICKGATTVSDVLNENVLNNIDRYFFADAADELGLATYRGRDIADSIEAASENDECAHENLELQHAASKLLATLNAELDECIDLNKVYEIQELNHNVLHKMVENTEAAMTIDRYLRDHGYCLLKADTGGYFVYWNEIDMIMPSLEITIADNLDDKISVTSNGDGTYHIEVVGNDTPSDLFKQEYGDQFSTYQEAIASKAITDVDQLSVFADLYTDIANIVSDLRQSANKDAAALVDKYDLKSFARYENFAKAADDLKDVAPDIWEKHQLAIQMTEIYGARNAVDCVSLDSVYDVQRLNGMEVFENSKRYCNAKNQTKGTKRKDDIERS